jgi:hypothetical protein
VSGLISELGTLSNQQLLVVLSQHIHSQAQRKYEVMGQLACSGPGPVTTGTHKNPAAVITLRCHLGFNRPCTPFPGSVHDDKPRKRYSGAIATAACSTRACWTRCQPVHRAYYSCQSLTALSARCELNSII